eukprot:Lankesteria_metandrocarpae@DN5225_c0_g1_i3.p1
MGDILDDVFAVFDEKKLAPKPKKVKLGSANSISAKVSNNNTLDVKQEHSSGAGTASSAITSTNSTRQQRQKQPFGFESNVNHCSNDVVNPSLASLASDFSGAATKYEDGVHRAVVNSGRAAGDASFVRRGGKRRAAGVEVTNGSQQSVSDPSSSPLTAHPVPPTTAAGEISFASAEGQRSPIVKRRKPAGPSTGGKVNATEPEGDVVKERFESDMNCWHECVRPVVCVRAQDSPVLAGGTRGGRAPAKQYPYKLDAFQNKALRCLEGEESVLVAAHTSAGKTTVAEYAIAMSLRDKQRVVYTSPIKALSNQKFRDLSEEFSDVGLLTGDVSTIPNAAEFAEWICRIKHQPCHVIYTDSRPTPLQHFLFPSGSEGVHLVMDEQKVFREKNFHEAVAALQHSIDPAALKAGKRVKKKTGNDIEKIVLMCDERKFTPLIIFAFSKKEVEANAMSMKKVDLTVVEEKELIEEIFNNATATLSEEDRSLPQIQQILPLLKKGVGIHHGGLLPIVKEVIEILFQESLLKVLFSTETFSMGINMPAKTVLFTAVRKWDGRDFRLVSAGEYIQMSGRAGRRGLDDRGLSIIMFDEKIEPEEAKSLFMGEPMRIESQFRLGYNMLMNLLRVEGANADYMINRSFHQFQRDKQSLSLEEEEKRVELQLQDYDDVAHLVDKTLHISSASADVADIKSDSTAPASAPVLNNVIQVLTASGAAGGLVRSSSTANVTGQCVSYTHGESTSPATATGGGDIIWPCDDVESEIAECYSTHHDILALKEEIRTIITTPHWIQRYLQLGRIFHIKDGEERDFGFGVLLRHRKVAGMASNRTHTTNNLTLINTKPTDPHFLLEVVLLIDDEEVLDGGSTVPVMGGVPSLPVALSRKSPQPVKRTSVGMSSCRCVVVSCTLENVHNISKAKLNIMQNVDVSKPESLKRVQYALEKMLASPDSIQNHEWLDPHADMEISDPRLPEAEVQLEELRVAFKTSPLTSFPYFDRLFEKFDEKVQLQSKLKQLNERVQANRYMTMRDELRSMHRVLRRMQYVDERNVVTLKGRVACEISAADELVVAELLFQNLFDRMDVDLVVATLSVLVFEEKTEECPPKDQALVESFARIQEVARKIAEVSQECKLSVNIEDYVGKFVPTLMELTLGWVRGAKFVDLLQEHPTLYEGSVVRALRRLEELLRQLASGSRSIGNDALEAKFNEGMRRIKKGIVFAASLYL